MAGNLTQNGSELDLDLLAEELSQQIFGLEDIPNLSLGVGAGGLGTSVFSDNHIHLEQSPHTEVAYEWEPPADCQIELLSPHACVVVDSLDGFRTLDLPGGRAVLCAGTNTKFSVITSTGTVKLKVHEVSAR